MNIGAGWTLGICFAVAAACTAGVNQSIKETEKLVHPEDEKIVNVIRAAQFHAVVVGNPDSEICPKGETGMEFRAENSGDATVTGVACYTPEGTEVTLRFAPSSPRFKPRLRYP